MSTPTPVTGPTITLAGTASMDGIVLGSFSVTTTLTPVAPAAPVVTADTSGTTADSPTPA